ncbi:MAG: cobalt ECF transporter T component CbiQ [Chloroflexota bacterium]
MKHAFLDRYSDRDSFIHRLDPRTKLVTSLLFILAVLLTPPDGWAAYALYFGLLTAWLLLSRVPVRYVLQRSLVIMPFVLLVAVFLPFFSRGGEFTSYQLGPWHITLTAAGLQMLRNILARAWLSIISLTLLAATTRLPDLLKGMEQLRLPRVMVMVLSFMYRYLFVLTDEVMRLRQARDSRYFGGQRWRQLRTTGHMVGTLFLRSYERGERVYAAMLARGYDGQSRTLHHPSFRPADAAFGLGLVLILAATSLISRWP